MSLKQRIEQVLSEILSDKYECKITLRFGAQDETREKTDVRAAESVA